MKRLYRAIAVVTALLTITSHAAAERKHKPRHDFTTDTLMTHDPVVALEDGVYHAFSTGMGLQHATSKDLKTWAVLAKPVLDPIPEWTRDSVRGFKSHVWAPDVIRYRGKWWLAYSCSVFGKNRSVIGLASRDKLGGDEPWHDEGMLVRSHEGIDNWNAIDPNFVIDGDDSPWLVWGSFWDGIQLARLDSTMHLANPSCQRTMARRYTDYEGMENPVEAPFIFRHGDYYYLFVSWDYCCQGMKSTYKVVVGRSRNIEGPYLDATGKDMAQGGGTLVIEGDKREFEAAGHCSVYRFADNDYFFCHGYSVALDGTSILITRKIAWDSDGWPVLK